MSKEIIYIDYDEALNIYSKMIDASDGGFEGVRDEGGIRATLDFVQNDFLLIRKMKQGDDDALDLFVHKYYQDILNYCHYHCSDKTYAEDLAQETFVHFFSKLSDYHYRGKTLNYLYTIASNLCKDYLKKIKEIPLE